MKNTSPRTAPAMSCSRLKTGNGIRVSFGGGANPTSGNFLHFRKANLREFCFIHTWPIFLEATSRRIQFCLFCVATNPQLIPNINANILFYILWKKSRLKSTFLPYHVKKHHSTLKMDTLKSCCFFLISLRSITNLAHDFKSPFLDIEITNT